MRGVRGWRGPGRRGAARWAVLATLTALTAGCETLKPYEKEYLLSPLMDDAGVATLGAPLMSAGAGEFEKLGAGAGQAGGSSCPTCGG